MQLVPSERATAIASVPEHLRSIVEIHIKIAEKFEIRKIEHEAQMIAHTPERGARQAMLFKLDAVIRGRVKARVIEIYEQRKKEATNG